MTEGGVYLHGDENGMRDRRDPGIAGVAVSNGIEVAITDEDGRYQLPDSSEGLVWVSIPTGHRLAGPFYQRTDSADLDFGLLQEQQPDDFTFVYYTDLHIGEGVRGAERLAETLEEIAGLRPTPRFCLDGGDITLQGESGVRYQAILEGYPLPIHHSWVTTSIWWKGRTPRVDIGISSGPRITPSTMAGPTSQFSTP